MWISPGVAVLECIVYLVAAPTPADHMREITLHTGRMSPLPAWTQTGAVVGFEGGTQAVLNITAQLAAHGVPVAAMWLQVYLPC